MRLYHAEVAVGRNRALLDKGLDSDANPSIFDEKGDIISRGRTISGAQPEGIRGGEEVGGAFKTDVSGWGPGAERQRRG